MFWRFGVLGLLEINIMTFQKLNFYLDKNQSHGQNDKFLRTFLLKLKVCRPQEDLSFWQYNYYPQKYIIVLAEKLKNLKIIISDKTDLANDELLKSQRFFADETIKFYQQNFDSRERLIFIDLTNDLDYESILAYQLIENKKIIEFLQWRPAIEVKEWMESCLDGLEIENWFRNDLNNYLPELKN